MAGPIYASWLDDGTGFTYTPFSPAPAVGDPPENMQLRLHRLGHFAGDDVLLLVAGNGEGANTAFPMDGSQTPAIEVGTASPWAVATAYTARPELRLCVTPKAKALVPAAPWRCLIDFSDGVQHVALHGQTLYLLSMKDRPNGRILAMDLSQARPSLKQAHQVIASSNDSVINVIAAARDALYIRRVTNGLDHIDRVDYASGKATALVLPGRGRVQRFSAQPSTDGLVYSLQSWTRPRTAYAYREGKSVDLELGESTLMAHDGIVTVETVATSADGTQVPLTILHRKGVPLDGGNRALVYAYGGYGRSIQPTFRTDVLAWVNAGNVAAIAHVRGGGEKGDAWHRGGQGALKYKGVEDYVACVDTLVKARYSRPENVAVSAASMGGLIVGGVITKFPSHIGAAVIQVGMLNPVRLLAGINGSSQIAEVGDPRTEVGMKALAAMDPFQHIRKGAAYPAVLLTVGLNDSRVPTWESGKFVARVRAASSHHRPVWIRTDAAAGHGADSMDAAASEAADIFAFLDAQLPGRGEHPPESPFVPHTGSSNSNLGFAPDVPVGNDLSSSIARRALHQFGDGATFTSQGQKLALYVNGNEVVVPTGLLVCKSGAPIAASQVTLLTARMVALKPSLMLTEWAALVRNGATPSADGKLLLIDPRNSVALLKKSFGGAAMPATEH